MYIRLMYIRSEQDSHLDYIPYFWKCVEKILQRKEGEEAKGEFAF